MQAEVCPAAVTQIHWVGCPPIGGWPGGDYYIDATGGEYTSIPEIRRVGVAVARMTGAVVDTLGVEWGLFLRVTWAGTNCPQRGTICHSYDCSQACLVHNSHVHHRLLAST